LIAWHGEAVCFLIDGISYGAVLISLYFISILNPSEVERHESWYEALSAGIRYSLASAPIRTIISVTALVSLLGTPQFTLLPVFARDVFQKGPELLGYLTAISGFGAFLGAIFLASRKYNTNLGTLLAPMPFLIGCGNILLALSPSWQVAALGLLVSSFSMVILFAGMNSAIQLVVEDKKRARVMSLFSTGFFTMLPIAGLLSGLEAQYWGAQATVAIGGVSSIVIGLYWVSRIKLVHPRGDREC